ncbi:hypothetical protein JW926_07670 [Candidatus Sumerlaeota bacterium]|nr:hypothetical protein [Candidatus Sumerlaeota bacterium]
MKKALTITTHEEQAKNDRAFWRSRSPEERLDAVEILRLESGKFLYEYPSRLRRIVTIIGFKDLIKNKKSTQRPKDKVDVEELTQ